MAVTAASETLGECAFEARQRLPRLEADLLVSAALGVSTATTYAFPERKVPSSKAARLNCWVERRSNGEPVAYILRQRGFWGLDLEVTPAALIPRPDTETLVEAALPLIHGKARVLDVGTGCGNIALAIAHERPDAHVVATDIDPRCVELCQRNAKRLGLRVETVVGDCFDGVAGKFDVIVSNPPYVADDDEHLERGDLRFEPRRALVGGANAGLDFIARLVPEAAAKLKPGGWLDIEHGHTQAMSVRRLLRTNGFGDIRHCTDIENRPRVSLGRMP